MFSPSIMTSGISVIKATIAMQQSTMNDQIKARCKENARQKKYFKYIPKRNDGREKPRNLRRLGPHLPVDTIVSTDYWEVSLLLR